MYRSCDLCAGWTSLVRGLPKYLHLVLSGLLEILQHCVHWYLLMLVCHVHACGVMLRTLAFLSLKVWVHWPSLKRWSVKGQKLSIVAAQKVISLITSLCSVRLWSTSSERAIDCAAFLANWSARSFAFQFVKSLSPWASFMVLWACVLIPLCAHVSWFQIPAKFLCVWVHCIISGHKKNRSVIGYVF